jgi:putative PEP-CTERM system histidine kinase
MTAYIVISYLAALTTLSLAVYVLLKEFENFAGRVLFLGLGILGLEAIITGFIFTAGSLETLNFLLHLKIVAASFLPILWLLFSISFARTNFEEFVFRWRFVLLLTLIVPFATAIFLGSHLYKITIIPEQSALVLISLNWAGYVWYLNWLICAVLIIMNLERTIRHVTGHMQWQIKFMVLGIVSIFAIRIYTYSQVMIFQRIDIGYESVNMGILIVANLLIARSLFRGNLLNVQVHLSQTFLYQSFTLLLTGVYFIGAGFLAWLTLKFGGNQNLQLTTFLVFVALVGYAALMLSGRLRVERKRFISRHFKAPKYDYRAVWEQFTAGTVSLASISELSDFIVRVVSDTLETPSVSIWVAEGKDRLTLGGSTILTPSGTFKSTMFDDSGSRFIQAMDGQALPFDLEKTEDDWIEDLRKFYADAFKKGEIRFCVPLIAAGELIGIMTVGNKVSREPLSFEDSELLKAIADQTAASILNRQLLRQLRKTQELEAFQTMSAFFMHDLKNLASKLSLVTQNLPIHIDNPDFRKDAIRTISESVAKINGMCGRLSLLSRKLELELEKTDINALLESAIAKLTSTMKAPVTKNFKPVPAILLDPEQLTKVLENLIINAQDAVAEDGVIQVGTSYDGQWAEMFVSDNGCGMTKEFVENKLFHPFQTTKKQGMGIGLFHCKTIVEAHGGLIEVESELGKGTLFRVKLPLISGDK